MKKFLINTALFLLFALGFYLISLIIWSSLSPHWMKSNLNYQIGAYGHMHSRLSEVKDFGEVDILFLGSSHAYRGFDTRIFSENGFKTFNLGSSSQTPIQTQLLLSRYLEKLNPKLIIYEVYPETFMLDGVESSLDVIANDKNDLGSLKMALNIHNIKTYNTLIYGYIRDFFNVNKSYVEPKHKDNDTYICGGYVEKELEFYQPTDFKSSQISFKDSQLTIFSDIVKLINNKGIELILVYAPNTKVYYDSYSNPAYFDNVMQQFGTYYNFNKTTSLNDSLHFYDFHHLNQIGVSIFNDKLIDVLNNASNTVR